MLRLQTRLHDKGGRFIECSFMFQENYVQWGNFLMSEHFMLVLFRVWQGRYKGRGKMKKRHKSIKKKSACGDTCSRYALYPTKWRSRSKYQAAPTARHNGDKPLPTRPTANLDLVFSAEGMRSWLRDDSIGKRLQVNRNRFYWSIYIDLFYYLDRNGQII